MQSVVLGLLIGFSASKKLLECTLAIFHLKTAEYIYRVLKKATDYGPSSIVYSTALKEGQNVQSNCMDIVYDSTYLFAQFLINKFLRYE